MISTEIKNLDSCKRELTLTIPKEELEPIREKQVKRVRREVQFPGFRKGKAPLNMVKSKYADEINAYTIDDAMQYGLEEAAKNLDLMILGQPEAKKVDFTDDGGLVSIIEFETHPEIELKEYKGLQFIKDKTIVTDKTVDASIDRLLQQKAEVTSVDGPIEEGHLVVMDMQELDEEGQPLKGKLYKDISLKMGEGRFDKELEDQLHGLKNGEQKQIEKVYADDYPQKEIAGKKEKYNITIKNVQLENLPELNDEFVKDLGAENMQTVADLRRVSREAIENQAKNEADNRLGADIAQAIVEKNPLDTPRSVLADYLQNIVKDVKQKNPQAKEEDIMQQYEGEAAFTLKWHYLQDEIAKVEKLEVTEDDENKFLEELKDDNIRKVYQDNEQLMGRVKDDILRRKVFDFLVENSKIKENEIKLD